MVLAEALVEVEVELLLRSGVVLNGGQEKKRPADVIECIRKLARTMVTVKTVEK